MLKQNSELRNLQTKIGLVLAGIPLSPNQWTILSLLLASIGAAMIMTQNLYLGLGFFALAAILDLVDGAVARARGDVTKIGGFIDGVVDRFVEALFLFSFMFYPLPTVLLDPKIWLAVLVFLGACMPSFIRAYAHHKEVISKEIALSMGGIFERGERLILIGAGLFVGIFYGMELFVYAIILGGLLSAITTGQRITEICRSR